MLEWTKVEKIKKQMKKSLFIVAAVALLFAGSVGLAKAQTAMSDSALLAQLFDIVTDLAKAVSSIIERQIDSFTGNTGSTPAVIDTARTPAPVPVPKPSPEPGVISFKVTSPAAGERWTIGKTYEVKWENDNPTMGAAESPNFVSLYLVSTNNISKRPSVLWTVAAYTRNTGSYKWTVSKNVYPGEYQLAVEPYARPDRRSYGGTFAIISDATAPSTTESGGSRPAVDLVGGGGAHGSPDQTSGDLKIKITNPSETKDSAWVKGKQYTIQWQSTDPSMSLKETDFLSIYLVGEKDTARSLGTISSKAYNDGDYRWTIPTRLASGVYRIVLQSLANTSLKAMSSEFSVSGATTRIPKADDVLFTKAGKQTKIGGGEIINRPVWCCNNCYIESGGTCGGCFSHCGQGNY